MPRVADLLQERADTGIELQTCCQLRRVLRMRIGLVTFRPALES